MPDALKGGVIAIGNFDGVHRGHRGVLDAALEVAKRNNVPACVLTFEPHPRTWFRPEHPVFRLTPSAMKAELLESLGFDAMIEQRFDGDFAGNSAIAFIEEFLGRDLAASHVITGYDFHFGKKRQGTPEMLAKEGKAAGFDVTLIEAISDENREVISSSRIRAALGEGDIALANGLLGYGFRLRGTVIEGKKLGRELGFPTANILLPAETTLAYGIYAVRVIRKNGDRHDGVASYGRRPTFENGEALFETFLFDFSGDLYGEELTVYLHSKLRDEVKFENADDLIEQMKIDDNEARQFLQGLPENAGLWPQYAQALDG
ncbi:MAG: bifunctional riboflavin kinase/FMN adenylyltransferase [Hyphomicrobiales bacterium]|nr:MAG: bifunctional riboflavin kinase/FMN adenylyltransferase [Hyphomicrobiales bacterium]